MMKYMERVIFGGLVLLMLPVSGFAACSTAQWNGGVSGAVSVASPPTLSRVSEFCAMQATDTGHVQDNSPSEHFTFIARFYVRPTLTGSGQADVFVAYDNDTPGNQLFKVSYDGANLDFHSTSSTQLGTALAASGKWHLVEVEYNSGGQTRFWVNANAVTNNGIPTGSYDSAVGGVESVRLGLPNGRGGFSGGGASFDAYESHSMTPVGPLLIGDGNGDGNVNSGDTVAVLNEWLGGGSNLGVGQPDCNLDGSVNSGDTVCVLNKWLGGG